MTAIKAAEVEALLRRGIAPAVRVALLYGPDIGLAAERAAQIANAFVEDPADPFAVVTLDGDALEPGRLADEAGTIGLFGGRRAIRVRAGSRNLVPAVEAVLEIPGDGSRIVIEGGDLGRTSPLRALCERTPRALALPCYPAEGGQLIAFIEEVLRADDLALARDARQVLAVSLGGDRRAVRGEIDKLALYARGRGTVTLEDVEAVVSDASGTAMNAVIDAAFAGRVGEVEQGRRRLRLEGVDPGVLLGTALRHALALLAARIEGDAGKSDAALVASWRGLHFRRQRSVEGQLSRWSATRLTRAVAALQEGILAARRADPGLAQAQAGALLLRLAAGGERGR